MNKRIKIFISILLSFMMLGTLTAGGVGVEDVYAGKYDSVENRSIKKIVTGGTTYNETAVLFDNGDLYIWGPLEITGIRNGSEESPYEPYKVMEDVEDVRILGGGGCCPLIKKTDGSVYIWEDDSLAPERINNISDINNYNYSYDYFLDDSGSLYNNRNGTLILNNVKEFGSNYAICYDGSLYKFTVDAYSSDDYIDYYLDDGIIPVKIMDNVRDYHSCTYWNEIEAVITDNGDLYIWDSYSYEENKENQITLEKYYRNIKPVKVMENVKDVIGDYHYESLYFITEDNKLYSLGNNEHGQMGNGNTETVTTPYKVLDDVKHVGVYNATVAALKYDGSLYMWGNNYHGQIGDGSNTDRMYPYKVLDNVKDFDFNNSQGLALCEDGSLYRWGNNESGDVGNGTTMNQNTPVKVLDNIKQCYGFTTALSNDGELYRWGYNLDGRVGNGSIENQLLPIIIMNNVVDYIEESYTGYYIVVTAEGYVYDWESDRFGSKRGFTPQRKIFTSRKSIEAFIYRMYTVALGREEVDDSEIKYWSDMLENHERTGADMAFQFCCGEEFKNRNLSDDEFSKIMYRVYMNRERGEGDQDGWTIPLANGANRKWIMAKFVNSPEYTMICWDYGIDRGTLDVPDSEQFAPN